MYTLLIADDEALVRRGISQVINWETLGFTTIYQAEDGLEALELMRRHKVDLLLTDIVMPHMDGLALSQAVTQEFPETRIVVLTGHEDFEYAKKSIDLGVKNYILKPVGAESLYAKMKNICEKMQMEANQKQYMDDMRRQMEQSKPLIQEKYLYTLVCTRRQSGEVRARLAELDIRLGEGPYIVGVIEPGLDDSPEHELFYLAAKDTARHCVGTFAHIFDDNDTRILLVFDCARFAPEARRAVMYDTLRVIQKAIQSALHIEVTCGQGGPADTPEQLGRSYREALSALECRYNLGAGRVYDIDDVRYLDKDFYYPARQVDDLVFAVRYGGPAQVPAAFEALREELLGRSLSVANTKMVCVETLTVLLQHLSALKSSDEALGKTGFRLYEAIGELKSLEGVLADIGRFAGEVAAAFAASQSSSSREIVEDVRQYVLEHYSEPELSLAMAAESVSVSTGYLSALFKKETGTNFVKFLTDLRMKRARELLLGTDMRTYEVADAIGFTNPHYFSIAFKKSSGLSPSEYRQMKEEQGK